MDRGSRLTWWALLTALTFPLLVFAQSSDSRLLVPHEKISDTFAEMETGDLTLRFFNALNGEPIPDAIVAIGDVGGMPTDFEGKVRMPMPVDGVYNVSFDKTGFVPSRFTIEVMANTLFFNRFSISPSLPPGTLRIVLDWDKNPADLDIHLKKKGAYHISYRNMKSSEDGIVRLDRDDTDSYGPETITVDRLATNGTYVCFIHDYTNKGLPSSDALSKSKACVKVFNDTQLLHVYQVPLSQIGNYWSVFTITNCQILAQNMFLNQEPMPDPGASTQTR